MPDEMGLAVGTTLRIVGKCRGCGKEHDGPMFWGVRMYEEGVCLIFGVAEDAAFHVIHSIPLMEINSLILRTFVEGMKGNL